MSLTETIDSRVGPSGTTFPFGRARCTDPAAAAAASLDTVSVMVTLWGGEALSARETKAVL